MREQLETNRLYLIPIDTSVLESIHELNSVPETNKFNTIKVPLNIEETEVSVNELIQNNNNGKDTKVTYKVVLINDKSFIGLISINLSAPKYKSVEVWFKFHSNYWKNGYATKSLKEILCFGFKNSSYIELKMDAQLITQEV